MTDESRPSHRLGVGGQCGPVSGGAFGDSFGGDQRSRSRATALTPHHHTLVDLASEEPPSPSPWRVLGLHASPGDLGAQLLHRARATAVHDPGTHVAGADRAGRCRPSAHIRVCTGRFVSDEIGVDESRSAAVERLAPQLNVRPATWDGLGQGRCQDRERHRPTNRHRDGRLGHAGLASTVELVGDRIDCRPSARPPRSRWIAPSRFSGR